MQKAAVRRLFCVLGRSTFFAFSAKGKARPQARTDSALKVSESRNKQTNQELAEGKKARGLLFILPVVSVMRSPYTPEELAKEVKRELALRKVVYPSLVKRGKMTQQQADEAVQKMHAVLDILNERSIEAVPVHIECNGSTSLDISVLRTLDGVDLLGSTMRCEIIFDVDELTHARILKRVPRRPGP